MKNSADCATFKPMKKALLAALFLWLYLPAPADELKAMLEFHSSKYLFSSEVTTLNHQPKSGLAFGLGYAFAINSRMRLEVNALYAGKGAKTSIEYAQGKEILGVYRSQVLALPLFFKYRFREGSTPYAGLGPEFNFILSHKLTIPEYEESFNISAETKKLVLAYNIALGYELLLGQWGLFAEARYNHWLGNLWKSPAAKVKGESLAFILGGIYRL